MDDKKLLDALIKNGLLDMNTRQLAVLLGFGLAVYQLNRNKLRAATVLPPALDTFPVRDYLPPEIDYPGAPAKPEWVTPEEGMKFEAWFKAASVQYSLPHGLLSRVAYQESRYNTSARSHAGAIGLMQIVPKWHPDVDPLDPHASIFYAARYLRNLRKMTGSWPLALAAYNWGIGNLRKKGIDNAPKETRDYIAQISADVMLT